MQRESREPTDADLAEVTAYLKDGGIGETYTGALIAWATGATKVLMDPLMALALLKAAANASREHIVSVAFRLPGCIVSTPRPARHGDVLRAGVEAGIPPPGCPPQDQGFLTNTGRFVDRTEALAIAQAAGQTKPDRYPFDELYSEDLW